MEFCNDIISLFHTRHHSTIAVFRSFPGSIIINNIEERPNNYLNRFLIYIYISIYISIFFI